MSTSENIAKQSKVTYQSYKKIKDYIDIGHFLVDYVISGGEVTKDPLRNDQINISEISAVISNDVMTRDGTSLTVSSVNTTYYVDFYEGDFTLDTVHPPSDYLPLAQVKTDSNGLISEVIDLRTNVGGLRVNGDVVSSNGISLDKLASLGENINGTPNPNHIEPTLMRVTEGTRINAIEGTDDNPSTDNGNPVAWFQKITSFDSNDRVRHDVGAVMAEVVSKGSGVPGSSDVENTWISIIGNAVCESTNHGDAVNQDWDNKGNIIGVTGFARADGFTNGIVTALWGYASTSNITDEEFDNAPGFMSTALELNIDIRHKDPGPKDLPVGQGTTAGIYMMNYQKPNVERKDWSFGIAFNGANITLNGLDENIDNWSGFHTGILLDKIKKRGILMGRYFKNDSYGIEFPNSYAGTNRPKAGIYMGNTQINMGNYLGSTFSPNDLWANGEQLFFRRSRHYDGKDYIGAEIITTNGVSPGAHTQPDTHSIFIKVGKKHYSVNARLIE